MRASDDAVAQLRAVAMAWPELPAEVRATVELIVRTARSHEMGEANIPPDKQPHHQHPLDEHVLKRHDPPEDAAG
ncbi:MAG: hypothetical protein RLN60_04160 [Phycisphaerales bacterium]